MASIFKRSKRKNEPYTIQYLDHLGKRRTEKAFTDKGLSEQLAAKRETEARLRTTGLVDVELERLAEQRKGDIEPHLTKFGEKLNDNSPKHAGLTMFRVRRIIAGAKFKTLADIQREGTQDYLRTLCTEEELGNRTFNHYLQAIDSFCNWCVDTNRLLKNPLRGLERRNAEVDVRHPRRALSPENMSLLIETTRASRKKVQNLIPETRARVYLFSCLTGLRKAEMASLSPSSFGLDGNPPTVTVAAACSKHRRKDVLPLHPELVPQLREWTKGLGPTDKLFPLLAKKKLSEMIQKDLHRAGIPYRTEEGIADFHAAGRHTYITQLLRNGVSLPAAKELARHTDVKMTMRYTHIGIEDQAKAVARLPTPRYSPNVNPAAPPTRQPGALQMRCISGGVGCPSVSKDGTSAHADESQNPFGHKGFGVRSRNASLSVKAEGTGLEPATGFPAPHFQCGR
jgi:site-specific recombinase XerD